VVNPKKILVTGGLGFIGSSFVEMALARGYTVINIDKMTYAAREDVPFKDDANYSFIKKDIAELTALPADIGFIVNFAAESHVDNSIKGADAFIRSNIYGVYNILELIRKTDPAERPVLIQISTDEVYGDILEGSFKETDRLRPSNPYSATKASAEELIMGWGRTHQIPWRITRSSNNYGFGQRAEKFIPRIMKLAIKNEKAKIYGNGLQRREWTHTEDNNAGIFIVMERGTNGEIYNISSGEELTNLEVAKKVLRAMGKPEDFYEMVADRPGHDLRYSVDSSKIRALGWKPQMTLDRYLPICRAQNEERTRNMPPGKKARLARMFGLGRFITT
jgi:dTDP-glucose 4,6-dehydratase